MAKDNRTHMEQVLSEPVEWPEIEAVDQFIECVSKWAQR